MLRTKEQILDLLKRTYKHINRDIKKILYPEFSTSSEMYSFTTENLSEYSSTKKLDNKKILTVTSSGDHIFNFALAGARNIDCFDLNENAYYMAELKKAAIKVLSYEEYLNYFCSAESVIINHGFLSSTSNVNPNDKVMDVEVYKRIRNVLPEDVCFYWDNMYKLFDYDGALLTKKVLYDIDKRSAVINNNYLKNEKNYNKLKQIIDEIKTTYHDMDIMDIYKLDGKYDLVYLSNIYSYITDPRISPMTKEEFNEYVETKLNNLLNENGIISLYQYNYKSHLSVYKNNILKFLGKKYELYQNPELEETFNKKLIVSSYMEEYRKHKDKDVIYIYEGKSR